MVTLPLAGPGTGTQDSAPEQQPLRSLSEPELEGLRLLLIEDDFDSREIVATILGDTGIDVTCAGSAEQALELLGNQPIDVILSDVGLPGTDGYELMRIVRTNPALAKTPAAALTAYAYIEDRERALKAGFQMHLRKPFEHAELLDVVAALAKIAATAN
jgi:CheY-like chemotaxis protein